MDNNIEHDMDLGVEAVRHLFLTLSPSRPRGRLQLQPQSRRRVFEGN